MDVADGVAWLQAHLQRANFALLDEPNSR